MAQDIEEYKSIKKYNLKKGIWGETQTCNYLEQIGYKIFERNYRCYFGEIDIIAFDQDILVFIEVKMRTTKLYGQGLEAISNHKRNTIRRVARYFLHTNWLFKNNIIRFDVVDILNYKGIYYGKVIKNAF
jgi:putative endonuclease